MTPSKQSLALVRYSKPGLIYVATNNVTGKMYVGQTVSRLKERRQGHIRKALRLNSRSAFHDAIRRYGIDSFSFVSVQQCNTRSDLNAAEMWWISCLKTIAPRGYNLTNGGDTATPTMEVRKKIGDAHRGTKHKSSTKGVPKPWARRKKSEAERAAISKALKGKPRPGTNIGRNYDSLKGKPMSPEAKERMFRGRDLYYERRRLELHGKKQQLGLDFDHGGSGV